LVWSNLLVAGAAMVPSMAFCCFWVLHESGKVVGDAVSIPEMFSLLLVVGVTQAGFAICVPVLLPACFLLPALVRAQQVPSRVRKRTAIIVAAALIIMLATVSIFYFQHRQGGANGLFT
jgi:hypothetical protein